MGFLFTLIVITALLSIIFCNVLNNQFLITLNKTKMKKTILFAMLAFFALSITNAQSFAYVSSTIPYAQIGGASGTVNGYASVADTKIVLSNPIKNAVLRPYNAEIKFYDPAQSASYHNIRAEACAWDTDTYLEGFFLNASYLSATSITAIRFLMSTGNIAGGIFKLYGIK